LFDTRAGVVSAEVELQWAARVLHEVDSNGERVYWNQAIGNIKFIAKEQLSPETKLKMSEWQRGENNNSKRPEVRAKMSEAAKARCNNEQAKERMSAIGKQSLGKPKTEEHKRKISEALKKSKAKNNE
jgi:hypothetical protein